MFRNHTDLHFAVAPPLPKGKGIIINFIPGLFVWSTEWEPQSHHATISLKGPEFQELEKLLRQEKK